MTEEVNERAILRCWAYLFLIFSGVSSKRMNISRSSGFPTSITLSLSEHQSENASPPCLMKKAYLEAEKDGMES